MQQRIQYGTAYPDAYKAMLALSQAVEKTGLAPQLIDLINYRVSTLRCKGSTVRVCWNCVIVSIRELALAEESVWAWWSSPVPLLVADRV
jgi:hypothetical protein